MSFNINDVRANFQFEGARPTLFNCQVFNPTNAEADGQMQFVIQTATLPPSVLGEIALPYFGRKVYVAGDRTYPAWSVKVRNDEDNKVRNALEQWSDSINSRVQNLRVNSAYHSSALITQFGKDGGELRIYRFNALWPKVVGEIGMDWDGTDMIEVFDVEFRYDYWDIEGGITGDAGGI